MRVHTVRGIFIIFSSGGALAAWAAGHALHRCAGLLKGGKRAGGEHAGGERSGGERAGGERSGGEKPAPGFDRAALSATTAPEPQTRAAHQRDAARARARKARGAWIRCRPRARNPTCGQRAPSWAANSAVYPTNRRIVYCPIGLESGIPVTGGPCDRDPVLKVQGPVQEDSEKSERAAVPPNTGTVAALPLPTGTRRLCLCQRLSGFIWCHVFAALLPPGSRAFGDEPRINDSFFPRARKRRCECF